MASSTPPQDPGAPTLMSGSAHPGDGKAQPEETIGLPGDDKKPKVPAIAIPPERTQTVGPYTLLRLLGRGGMGAVWEAHDTRLNRRVAVKVMVAGEDASAQETERFKREAQNSAKLRHPNIVPVHDFGVERGRHYLVMDLVDGVMLADALRQRQFTYREKAALLEKVARAVQYAHEQGVIHRDLKPSNVMLEQKGGGAAGRALDGTGSQQQSGGAAAGVAARGTANPQSAISNPQSAEPLVMDFGLAKDITQDSSLSQSGQVMGTPAYMPPEQAEGRSKDVGPCSDVYSLGAILYEMLTARPPFTGENVMQVLRATLTDDPVPPRQIAAGVPRDLETICLKCLHKKPERRYASAAALADDVKAWLSGEPIVARAVSPWERAVKRVRRNPAVYGVSAAAVIIIVAVTAGYMWSLQQKQQETAAALAQVLAEKEAKERAEAARRAERSKSAPAFLNAARLSADQKKFDDALAQVAVAIEYAPDFAEARLFKAQLHIIKDEYPAAVAELDRYLKDRPDDKDAAELRQLSTRAVTEKNLDPRFAAVFERQKAWAFSERKVRSLDRLLPLCNKRLQASWPGVSLRLNNEGSATFEWGSFHNTVRDLSPLAGMPVSVLDLGRSSVASLSPLQGTPLTWLSLDNCRQITDLSPLKGAPLKTLCLNGCEGIADLMPLQGMPLTWLKLSGCKQIRDLSPLQGMRLTWLDLTGCGQIRELAPLKGMPLTWLALNGCAQIRELAPLKGMPLTWLDLEGCGQIKDLAALKGMPLTSLSLWRCGQIKDLSPLQDMPLTRLSLARPGPIRDLSPLKGMPLTWLDVSGCDQIKDLTPLKGMPLTELRVDETGVTDLTQLQGMELGKLQFSPKNIRWGMEVIRKMKSLGRIGIGGSHEWPTAEFWKKYDAGEFNK